MRCSRILASLVLVAGLTGVAGAANSEQMQQSVGDKVYCLCGCVAALNHCPHPQCQLKAEMHGLIAKDAAAGKDEPAILQDFVQQYGQKVLASPPPEGFNLAAWILPGLGLIIGLLIALAIVQRWRRPAVESVTATPVPMDEKLRAAVEDEMKNITG